MTKHYPMMVSCLPSKSCDYNVSRILFFTDLFSCELLSSHNIAVVEFLVYSKYRCFVLFDRLCPTSSPAISQANSHCLICAEK